MGDQFVYQMKVTLSDASGAAVPRWRGPSPTVTLRAATCAEAHRKARLSMGDPPGGYRWKVDVLTITEGDQ